MKIKTLFAALGLGLAVTLAMPAVGQTTGSVSSASKTGENQTYTSEEIISTGHRFFGKTTRGPPRRSNMSSRARASPPPISSARGLRRHHRRPALWRRQSSITRTHQQHIYWQAHRLAGISAVTALAGAGL
jgi:hypothetical protein